MLTIRCTRKLLEGLGAKARRDLMHPTSRLGDWYANVFPTARGTLVICVSERSLLPVFITAARDPNSFTGAFQEVVQFVLREIGVASKSVQDEMKESSQIAISATANRQVLGSLNDLAYLARSTLEDRPRIDLKMLAVELADTPCSPLGYESPRSVTLTLLRIEHA